MEASLPTAADAATVATGLRFPEGPVPADDGSLFVVEVAGERISRIGPDGTVAALARVPGGPNGLARRGDALLVCNNGGYFGWQDHDGLVIPGPTPDAWQGGSLDRVDPASGERTVLCTDGEGRLRAPNDLVRDDHGGVWFTDHGVRQGPDSGNAHQPSVLHAAVDGSAVVAAIVGLDAANGIGLSPDGDELYVAETHTGRLWAWPLEGPGRVGRHADGVEPHGGRLLHDAPEGHLFDSLAVDGEGFVVVGTLANGGLTVVDPRTREAHHLPMPDPLVTNVCFGGPDGRTAYCTGSGAGIVFTLPWPRPGTTLVTD